MRYSIPPAIAAALLALGACGIAHASSAEDSLRSSIHHESDEVFQKDACQWKAGQLFQQGSRLLVVFPSAEIKAVEVQGPTGWQSAVQAKKAR